MAGPGAIIGSSETESGAFGVGGTDLVGFMTRWGDGIFDIGLDGDSGGRPVTLRVMFAEVRYPQP